MNFHSGLFATVVLLASFRAQSEISAATALPGMHSIVQDSQATAVILLADSAAPDEILAANELQKYAQSISGARLVIEKSSAADLPGHSDKAKAKKLLPILVGDFALTAANRKAIEARGNDPSSFLLKVEGNAITIAGLSPAGTLIGTYEFLEQLGVRWFMPGEIGTVIPSRKTLQVAWQETIQVPSFGGRWHGGLKFPEWARHVRMGGPSFPSAHGIKGTGKGDFAAHPDLFALVDGERRPRQLHISSPEVIARAVEATKKYFRENPGQPWIGMGPNDGSGFCECASCRALDAGDWDPLTNEPSMTDRYIWFFNQILEGIEDEFPDKKIGFYCYHSYMRPPLKTTPNPRIVPAFAPLTLCRVHGMNNPICPERSYYAKLMEQWGQILPEVYERGYWFNAADPGFPFSEIHKMRDEIPAAHKLGIKGWRVETINHWGSETPSLYIAAKLMWNHEADVDALLQDFYEKFFGPAQKPMAQYFTLMDATLRDSDYHTGSSFDTPLFYPSALRKRARQKLNEAGKLAGEGIYARRVKVFRSTFDYLETFIEMLEDRNAFNFTSAYAKLQKLDAQQEALIAFEPPLIHRSESVTYLKRFFRQPVEQGYARSTGGNEIAARFHDEWLALQDPQKIGEDIGLWKSEVRGGNWVTLKTSTLSWGDQGWRTYKGEAWYRQSVEVPARFAGKRIFLWFGGVDEKAKVWVNGQLLGISHGASFLPFEFDATPAILPGTRNVVTVRLINQRVDELGTGGITAPVMLYAPAAGKDAVLDNVRDMAPIFP